MKLKESFITHTYGDEHITVSAGSGSFVGLLRSNPTAAFIIEQLKEETTLQKIVDAMLEEYDAEREIVTRDVKNILDKLMSIDALEL